MSREIEKIVLSLVKFSSVENYLTYLCGKDVLFLFHQEWVEKIKKMFCKRKEINVAICLLNTMFVCFLEEVFSHLIKGRWENITHQ